MDLNCAEKTIELLRNTIECDRKIYKKRDEAQTPKIEALKRKKCHRHSKSHPRIEETLRMELERVRDENQKLSCDLKKMQKSLDRQKFTNRKNLRNMNAVSDQMKAFHSSVEKLTKEKRDVVEENERLNEELNAVKDELQELRLNTIEEEKDSDPSTIRRTLTKLLDMLGDGDGASIQTELEHNLAVLFETTQTKIDQLLSTFTNDPDLQKKCELMSTFRDDVALPLMLGGNLFKNLVEYPEVFLNPKSKRMERVVQLNKLNLLKRLEDTSLCSDDVSTVK